MKQLIIGLTAAMALFATSLFAAVNINTANKDGLMSLTGIGESKAQAIIDYREDNGPFESVDGVTGVSGIGEATLEKIRGDITVEEAE